MQFRFFHNDHRITFTGLGTVGYWTQTDDWTFRAVPMAHHLDSLDPLEADTIEGLKVEVHEWR